MSDTGSRAGLDASTAKALAHISACHVTLMAALEHLECALEIVTGRLLDRYDAAAGAIGLAIRTLHTIGNGHEHLEEAVLFPLLRDAVPDRAAWFDAMVAEHNRAHVSWAIVLPGLEQLRQTLEQGCEPEADFVAALRPLLATFVGTYRAHMVLEEQEILPLAARVLDSKAGRSLGQAFDKLPPY